MMNEIYVGNIGLVYRGSDENEASKIFDEYRFQSRAGIGRAARESVTWLEAKGLAGSDYHIIADIGLVYRGSDENEASKIFDEYRFQSRAGIGHYHIIAEYFPPTEE